MGYFLIATSTICAVCLLARGDATGGRWPFIWFLVAGSFAIGISIFYTDKKEIMKAQEDNNKKCPQCAETIKIEAKVCRYCHYEFNDMNV